MLFLKPAAGVAAGVVLETAGTAGTAGAAGLVLRAGCVFGLLLGAGLDLLAAIFGLLEADADTAGFDLDWFGAAADVLDAIWAGFAWFGAAFLVLTAGVEALGLDLLAATAAFWLDTAGLLRTVGAAGVLKPAAAGFGLPTAGAGVLRDAGAGLAFDLFWADAVFGLPVGWPTRRFTAATG